MKIIILLLLTCLPLFGDVRLTEVPRPSRAARSGLIPGDIIRQINGVPLADKAALQQALETAPDGAEILLQRVDREMKLRLAAKPETAEPHRLKTDWDKAEQQEAQDEATRRELIRLLQAPAPDAAAIRRCMEENDIETVSFYHDDTLLTLSRHGEHVFLRITDNELSSLYELGADGKENRLSAEHLRLLQTLPLD